MIEFNVPEYKAREGVRVTERSYFIKVLCYQQEKAFGCLE